MDELHNGQEAQIWQAIETELIAPLPLPAIPYVAAYLMTERSIARALLAGLFGRLADRAGVEAIALEPVHEVAARLHCLTHDRGAPGDDADALRATLAGCGAAGHAQTAAHFLAALPGTIKRARARLAH